MLEISDNSEISEMSITRENIISYFDAKDKSISKVLNRRISDCRTPFETAYKFHKYYSEDTNIMDLLLASSTINKYKKWIRVRNTTIKNERKNNFIDRIIRENKVNSEIEKLKFSVFVANQIVDDIKESTGFKFIITNKEYRLDSEYIIIDYPNLFKRIKDEYKGADETIIYIRNNIIKNLGMNACLLEFIKYFDENINVNNYKLIVIAHYREKDYEDNYFDTFDNNYVIIPISCERYIGERCDSKGSTSQVDDIVLLMIYDYIKETEDLNVSILSGDNFDFHTMTLDCIDPLRRAMISANDPPELMSHDDIEYSGIELTS